MHKPIIAVPMGDPAGVGPEIIIKALQDRKVQMAARVLIVGDRAVLEQAMTFCKSRLAIEVVEKAAQGCYAEGAITLLDMANVDVKTLRIGQVQAQAGKAAFAYLEKATQLALAQEVDAIATTPINKESLRAADVPHIGHTEMLEELTATKNPLTMFQVFDLRVFFLTRHVSLRRACDLVTEASVYEFIQRCVKALEVLGVQNPSIAVAGLNPHSGEHGLFGDEEVNEIEPAVKRAQADGVRVVGPVPADSVFHFGLKGRYDAVLSLYHDQGHIATKMVDFERTISITNNMPFLRTSVDHGTAFDIAGSGSVSEVSMVEAICLAALYAPSFNKDAEAKRG